jgi:hypothetical protein
MRGEDGRAFFVSASLNLTNNHLDSRLGQFSPSSRPVAAAFKDIINCYDCLTRQNHIWRIVYNKAFGKIFICKIQACAKVDLIAFFILSSLLRLSACSYSSDWSPHSPLSFFEESRKKEILRNENIKHHFAEHVSPFCTFFSA